MSSWMPLPTLPEPTSDPWIDIHTHLNHPAYDSDWQQVLNRARQCGLAALVVVGMDLPSSERAVSLTLEAPGVYATVGIHPHEVGTVADPEATYQALETLARHPRVVAWGEVGLDYSYEHSPRSVQREHFRHQIQVARRLGLPLVIHHRDAGDETPQILREEGAQEVGGVFHCFSGDQTLARQILDLGFYLSFSGVVTFRNARTLQEVARWVPLDRLLVETDCPYLAPHPYRGRRNEPVGVLWVGRFLADLRGIPEERLASQTAENARRLFGIPVIPVDPKTDEDQPRKERISSSRTSD